MKRLRKKLATPMLDKVHKVHNQSQELGAFLEWLLENYTLTTLRRYRRTGEPMEDDDGHLMYSPVGSSVEEILAQYFDINLDQVEVERQAVLAQIQQEGGFS